MDSNSIAYFLARVVLGILFFAQGYDKVFRIGIPGVIDSFRDPAGSRKIPAPLIAFASYFTSWVELIGGALLIIGLFRDFTLGILAVDLILVTAAFSLIKPMWDMQHVFPRLVLLITLLLLPEHMDMLSLDQLFRK